MPAFGPMKTGRREWRVRWRACSTICSGPVAQLTPITSTASSASSVVSAQAMSEPSSIAPVVSMVTLAMTGRRAPVSAKASSMAPSAAFACSRSWQVSTLSASMPPSISPSACSR